MHARHCGGVTSLASNDETSEPLENSEGVEGDTSNGETGEPLEKMTKSQLLEIAKDKGIEDVNSKTTNAQLIEKIRNA